LPDVNHWDILAADFPASIVLVGVGAMPDINPGRQLKQRIPDVVKVREFLEITRDFRDPKEAIREAISNALDWGASNVWIEVWEDKTRPDEEIIIRIRDDGVGLTEARLEAFFNLGDSTGHELDHYGNKVTDKIGEKGHGTKIFYNSRQIEVESQSDEGFAVAIMDSPLEHLLKGAMPPYGGDFDRSQKGDTYTTITIRGYDNNHKRDFDQAVLRDYVLWFTKFGSVESQFDVEKNAGKEVHLRALGQTGYEDICFGHIFAPDNSDIKKLREEYPGRWPKHFVKRWVFQGVNVKNNPGVTLDFVLYLEGDEAKRQYNPMIRGRGRPASYGTYKVEERYGLYACVDYIPVARVNEWISLGQIEWTKYHAFVNCQRFRLTANRGDITNTPRPLLEAIGATVRELYEEEIRKSPEFTEYDEEAELEEQYRDANQEREDFKRRQKLVLQKKVAELAGRQLVEPRQESGVVALFHTVSALRPELFPFRMIDFDTKRGYDAIAASDTVKDLSKSSMSFVEFKHKLAARFNHSFSHLTAVICWECGLNDGAEVTDLENKRRQLHVSSPTEPGQYTKYMLVSPTERHNIEVFVLKEYLGERLGLVFGPRKGS
jgi:hypothetical protein